MCLSSGIGFEVLRLFAKGEGNKILAVSRHAEQLLATGQKIIIEGNRWGDTCWGVDIRTGEGENRLGKILMKIRGELQQA